MKTKQAIQTILMLGAAVLAASSRGQTLLYDNGPVNGTITSRAINYGWTVTDSFTLATDSTVACMTPSLEESGCRICFPQRDGGHNSPSCWNNARLGRCGHN